MNTPLCQLNDDIYNCHVHTFKEEDIPQKFLVKPLMDYLRSKDAEYLATHLLEEIQKIEKLFSVDMDEVEKYLQFITIGNKPSQKEIFWQCAKNYSPKSKFFVLSMDMAYMGAGLVPRDYRLQLDELALCDSRIIPFIHIDPRRPDYFPLLRHYIEKKGFRGIKLYPPLGVFPFDKRYDIVYQYCTDNNLPIVSHCSPHNPVHFKGSRSEIIRLLQNDYFEVNARFKNRKDLCDVFTHPSNYEYVYAKFKDLRISLAHFGSAREWKKYQQEGNKPDNWLGIILEMMRKFPNLYADISYTMYHEEFLPLLKNILSDSVIAKKTLYGTDYYMPASDKTDAENALMIKNAIGENLFRAIAINNPERFLFGK